MSEAAFKYDAFLKPSAKDKAVVRSVTLSAATGERAGVRCRSRRFAERLRADGQLNNPQPTAAPLNKERHFLSLRLADTPIKGSLPQRTRIHLIH